jgi:hypothetical protein
MKKFGRRASLAILLSAFSLFALAQVGGAVVSVTSPASGSTVSGTISVTASTTGVVAGVQFRLDTCDLGAEVTTPPYSISWDTTLASNGPHTLIAVARDSLGIRFYSDPVAFTVANGSPPPPPPPPPNAQRFEDNSASVAYSSGWTQGDSSRPWSGGTAALSATPGARATLTFTGPSVTWIGGRNTNTARVYLDGVFKADVDTYQLTEEVHVTMFTLSGLAATSHTLTIEVTGQKNPASSSTLIVVDAFDVPGPAVTHLQETDPDITYSAGWVPDSTRAWSAGAATLTATAGSQATFPFTGTAVTWIGARGTQCGIARVFLDGTLVATVDAYSPREQIQAALFTATGLADAPHTLTISSTGAQNPAALGNLVVIDAFEVTTPGVMVQETDPSISYGPGWVLGIRDHAYNQAITAESNTTGARATFTFTGTGISWVSARGPQTGKARVYIDGAFVTDIDTYAPTESPQHAIFSARGLSAGTHTLTMEVTGKNPLSRDAWVLIDALVVVP